MLRTLHLYASGRLAGLLRLLPLLQRGLVPTCQLGKLKSRMQRLKPSTPMFAAAN